MEIIRKAYGYITRVKDGKEQILVFQHPVKEAGIQIPKGTVKPGENPYDAAIREVIEETGLTDFQIEELIAEDFWENDDGAIHNRYFYRMITADAPDYWDHEPTGGGEEDGLTFHFFWISSKDEVELVRGHGDYLGKVLGHS